MQTAPNSIPHDGRKIEILSTCFCSPVVVQICVCLMDLVVSKYV